MDSPKTRYDSEGKGEGEAAPHLIGPHSLTIIFNHIGQIHPKIGNNVLEES